MKRRYRVIGVNKADEFCDTVTIISCVADNLISAYSLCSEKYYVDSVECIGEDKSNETINKIIDEDEVSCEAFDDFKQDMNVKLLKMINSGGEYEGT